MKKTLFSKGLYVEGLRKLRVLGFIALALMIVIQIAGPITQYFSYLDWLEYSEPGEVYYPDTVSFDLVTLSVPLTAALVTPIMVLMLFSVFNKRSASDFYHSLPYTRVCLYLSNMAAVFTWIIGICVISGCVGLLAYISFPKLFSVVFDGAFNYLLTSVAFMLVSAGVCALGSAMTGTLFSNIAVSLLVMFLPRFILTVMTMEIGNNAWYLALDRLAVLSPTMNVYVGTLYYLFFEGDFPNFFENTAADIYTIVLGIIYIALALLVFTKRKSETATQPALSRAVQATVRILLTMVIGIFSVILFIEGEIAGCIIVTLISIVAYFAYELITTHRWKNCLRALPGLAIVLGISILCGAVMVGIPMISEKYTPDADDIDSVRFVDLTDNHEWFGKGTDKIKFDDPEILDIVAKTVKWNMKTYDTQYGGYITLGDSMYYTEEESNVYRTIAIKDGIFTRYRNVKFSSDDHEKILDILDEHEEYIKILKTLPTPADGTLDFYNGVQPGADASFYKKAFETLQEEIYELPLEDWYSIAKNMVGIEYGTSFDVSYWSDSYDSVDVWFPIPVDVFPRTFDMLLKTNELGYDERLGQFEKAVESFDKMEENYNHFDISATIYVPEEDGKAAIYRGDSTFAAYDMPHLWEDDRFKDGYVEALEKAKASDKKPSSTDGYIYMVINYEKLPEEDKKDEYKHRWEYLEIFLPIPEDFDPDEAGFLRMMEDAEVYEEKYW
ncbi:MAG: ABC transporter permease [Clostridia bacterium]|nr:ABC transporter permease [Clostridia bacterium]